MRKSPGTNRRRDSNQKASGIPGMVQLSSTSAPDGCLPMNRRHSALSTCSQQESATEMCKDVAMTKTKADHEVAVRECDALPLPSALCTAGRLHGRDRQCSRRGEDAGRAGQGPEGRRGGSRAPVSPIGSHPRVGSNPDREAAGSGAVGARDTDQGWSNAPVFGSTMIS